MEFLEKDAGVSRERAVGAQKHYILARLGDFGQHLVYRGASAVWEDPRWIPGGHPRCCFQDNLIFGAPFKSFFHKDALQLVREISDRYGTSLNIDQLHLILEFVR